MAIDLARLKQPVIFLCACFLALITIYRVIPAHVHYSIAFRYPPGDFSAGLIPRIAIFKSDDTPIPAAPPILNVTVMISGCGDRLNQAMTLVKSIFISSWSREKSHVKLYFFTEENQHKKARLDFDKLANSSAFRNKSISMRIIAPSFPNVGSESTQNMWRTMWRPCATQRLFMQDVLPDEDAMLYIDSDTRFLAPIQRMWSLFTEMNSSQVMGMAAEHEIESVAWYKKDRKPIHVEPLGVNSGVLIMNLTRMRAVNFTEKLLLHYEQYQKELVFHDQDLLNIQFNKHPEQLYILPCSWNYRTHHCMGGISNCAAAERGGIMLVHGNAGTLYAGTQLQSQFPEINYAMEKCNPNDDLEKAFREPLRAKMLSMRDDNHCKPFYFRGFGMDFELANKSTTSPRKDLKL